MIVLIKVGGAYCVALIVFHAFFWKIFNWAEELKKLNDLNRAIMQVLNISLTFLFAIIAYISFRHADELLTTALGHTLLGAIAMLWLFRAAQQVVFFKLKHWVSWAFLLFFLAGGAIYGIPFVYHT